MIEGIAGFFIGVVLTLVACHRSLQMGFEVIDMLLKEIQEEGKR